jgi:hypothetical protein
MPENGRDESGREMHYPWQQVAGWQRHCLYFFALLFLKASLHVTLSILVTEQVGSSGKASDLYPGDTSFESWTGHRVY